MYKVRIISHVILLLEEKILAKDIVKTGYRQKKILKLTRNRIIWNIQEKGHFSIGGEASCHLGRAEYDSVQILKSRTICRREH